MLGRLGSTNIISPSPTNLPSPAYSNTAISPNVAPQIQRTEEPIFSVVIAIVLKFTVRRVTSSEAATVVSPSPSLNFELSSI